MAVEAPEVDGRKPQGIAHHLLGLASLDGGAEFAVHLAGGYGLVGVGVDARRQAQEDFLADALLGGNAGDGVQLLPVVHHEVPNAIVHGEGNVPVGLVIGVKVRPLQGKAGFFRCVYFAGGDHVDTHALLPGNLIHALEAAGLAGIEGRGRSAEVLGKGAQVHAHILPNAHLIEEIEGCTVFLRQGHGVMAAEEEMAVGADGKVAAEHSDPTWFRVLIHHITKEKKIQRFSFFRCCDIMAGELTP